MGDRSVSHSSVIHGLYLLIPNSTNDFLQTNPNAPSVVSRVALPLQKAAIQQQGEHTTPNSQGEPPERRTHSLSKATEQARRVSATHIAHSSTGVKTVDQDTCQSPQSLLKSDVVRGTRSDRTKSSTRTSANTQERPTPRPNLDAMIDAATEDQETSGQAEDLRSLHRLMPEIRDMLPQLNHALPEVREFLATFRNARTATLGEIPKGSLTRAQRHNIRYPKLARNMAEANRKGNEELITIGRLPGFYDRHVAAPYAFNNHGKLYMEYRHLVHCKDANSRGWTVDEIYDLRGPI